MIPLNTYIKCTFYACYADISTYIYISSFMKIGRGVSELWGVENRPLPLTWPMVYTTVCITVQVVIIFIISLLRRLVATDIHCQYINKKKLKKILNTRHKTYMKYFFGKMPAMHS